MQPSSGRASASPPFRKLDRAHRLDVSPVADLGSLSRFDGRPCVPLPGESDALDHGRFRQRGDDVLVRGFLRQVDEETVDKEVLPPLAVGAHGDSRHLAEIGPEIELPPRRHQWRP